ncbi:TPA: DUF1003 domain-containing protein [Candidatus Woesearchaeota archaeon]|nr:MAG: hypothetical protein QS99_C0007G0042 [archaeon GW2011_AR4]HIH38491.1 DUF1003 domain-containing protein [Candidatus Woesearchaeota archaeon]HIH49769.1 DUF1003 domain-containing protein [Candidatus Woesearchaeota archaeon]HIJ03504.1 DUF1003 domain-containing protein [Candidatus Woesearchaeota archaeon]
MMKMAFGLKKRDAEISLEHIESINVVQINKEEVSIEDLHNDLEKKLQEQGFIFDKKKFITQDEHWTIGQRIADRVANFGGSWPFIILFVVFFIVWIALNIIILKKEPFDPFPFILLNLLLSCLASLQAPIIMMSQNRQAEKDRKQAEINLEKDIVDFKQDRLDLILDQKQWDILLDMDKRIKSIEDALRVNNKVKGKQKKKR